MNFKEVNKLLREALGPRVWAEGMYAAIAQDAPDGWVKDELVKASGPEKDALRDFIASQHGKIKQIQAGASLMGRGFRLPIKTDDESYNQGR